MFTSAELIEALRRRMRRSLRPLPPPGEFPPGWRDWFVVMAARPGRMAGAAAADIVAVVAARQPAVPPDVVQALGRWRAFTSLWRQDWQPASRDERWTRIASMSATLLLHLLFLVALAWLMFTRFHFPGAVEDARDGEEHVLQVEYIGEGTPAETGGGAPEAPVESPETPSPAAASAASTVSAAPSPPTTVPEIAPSPADAPPEAAADVLPPPLPERDLAIEVPQLTPPPVPAPQDLQVTVVDTPDSRFVVPPPREMSVEAPATVAPEVTVRRRDIDVEATTQVQPATRVPREVEVSVRDPAPQGVAVAERRIELSDVADVAVVPSRGLPAAGIRELAVEAPAARMREVPMPSSRPVDASTDARTGSGDPARGQASSAATRPVAGDGTATGPAATPPGGRPDAGGGSRSTGSAPGAGQRAGQPPGALPSTRAGDDWGDSMRNAPGRQAGTPGASGLFNADGSPRLADGGRVGGGLPPGTITEDFENIDRHGTWLKRPPYDYEPTAFDQFWLPGEDLLEEWVRRSVTEVLIPIPGTTKTIRCVTVLLALGGGCGIVDPNLQEQPAGARKPPDVPFKRELQEDQESLGPPPES